LRRGAFGRNDWWSTGSLDEWARDLELKLLLRSGNRQVERQVPIDVVLSNKSDP